MGVDRHAQLRLPAAQQRVFDLQRLLRNALQPGALGEAEDDRQGIAQIIVRDQRRRRHVLRGSAAISATREARPRRMSLSLLLIGMMHLRLRHYHHHRIRMSHKNESERPQVM